MSPPCGWSRRGAVWTYRLRPDGVHYATVEPSEARWRWWTEGDAEGLALTEKAARAAAVEAALRAGVPLVGSVEWRDFTEAVARAS